MKFRRLYENYEDYYTDDETGDKLALADLKKCFLEIFKIFGFDTIDVGPDNELIITEPETDFALEIWNYEEDSRDSDIIIYKQSAGKKYTLKQLEIIRKFTDSIYNVLKTKHKDLKEIFDYISERELSLHWFYQIKFWKFWKFLSHKKWAVLLKSNF